MAKTAKTVKIKDAAGKKEIEVSERAFDVVYSSLGYTVVESKKKSEK
jgi:hypothetical protein